MSRSIRAADDRWDVRLSRERPHAGVGVITFHCTTNSSHGWRVVEVPAGEYPSQERLDALEEAELQRLFERSQPFDYAHDPAAHDPAGDRHHDPGRD